MKKILLFLITVFSVNCLALENDLSPEEREAFYQRYQKRDFKYEGSYGNHLNQYSSVSEYEQERNKSFQIQNNILPENYKQDDFWSAPRRIYVQRTGRNGKKEVAEIIYYKNGRLDPQQYWLASYMLRDDVSRKMVYVDPKLLDLMAAIQAWLVYFGNNNPIIIHSGFRTVEHNSRLKGAGSNSMHLYGRAIDFRVEGVTVSQLSRLVAYFRAGGIGIYQEGKFVHMDTGGIRVWYGK